MKTQKVNVSDLPLFANDDVRDGQYVSEIVDQAHAMRSAAMRAHFRMISQPIAKWIRDIRTVRALENLTDDVLHDIGVERDQISTLVTGIPHRTLADRFTGLTAGISNFFREQRTVHELENLSDEMLDDIGIDRAQIHTVVAGMIDGTYRHYDLRANAALKLVHSKGNTAEPELPLAA